MLKSATTRITQSFGEKVLSIRSDSVANTIHCVTNNKLYNQWAVKNVWKHFYPNGYPNSVGVGYSKYMLGQAATMTLSAAGGVLSMQALLVAIGVGSASAPLAGTLNWIIKDGLGQLGGVVFASFVNNKFDENPKRWRLLSSIAMDISAVIEVCTPMFPLYFVPLASIANIGKNISFLAASASRASLNKSFAIHGNLADVTAKCSSQSILASMIGTGLGITVANLIPTTSTWMSINFPAFCDPGIALTTGVTMTYFLTLSGTSLMINYKSLQHVQLTTLTRDKLNYIFDVYMKKCDISLPLLPTSIPQIIPATFPMDLPTPADLAPLDVFLGQTSAGSRKCRLMIGSPLSDCFQNAQDLNTIIQLFSHEQYVITAYDHDALAGGNVSNIRSPPIVHLLFKHDATEADVVKGLVHAHLVTQLMEIKNHEVDSNTTAAASFLRHSLYACCPAVLDKYLWSSPRVFRSDLIELSGSLLQSHGAHAHLTVFDAFLQAMLPNHKQDDHLHPSVSGEGSNQWIIESFLLERNNHRIQISSEECK